MCVKNASWIVLLLSISACTVFGLEPPQGSGDEGAAQGETGPAPPMTSPPPPSSGDDADGGGSFVDTDPDPDAPVQCDPLDFFSCGRHHKCAPAILEVGGTWFDTAICVEIMGDHKEGEGCHSLDHKGGLDTCGAGLLCWDPDPETLVGMCVEMCEGPDPWAGGGCSDNKLCNSDKDGIVNLCLATCTPLDDDCPVGCMCQQSSAYSAFWCARMWGELELGDSCTWAGECGSGMACADASVSNCNEETTASCCVAFCDVTAEEPCAGSGEVCTLVFEENMINLDPLAVGVGHCRLDGAP